MSNKILLAATTSAAVSESFECNNRFTRIHFICPGLAGTEVATVEIWSEQNQGFVEYKTVDQENMSVENLGVVIDADGKFRVNKEATAAAVGVEVIYS